MSPTSIELWESDEGKEIFYGKYLSDKAPDREPQTQPMAVGSAFDAYAKSFLHKELMGNYGDQDAYRLDVIFEKQVEEHNRSFALDAGKKVWDFYKASGALADLMLDLRKASGEPKFETEVLGTVDGVPLLGRPDIYWTIKNQDGEERVVIFDWKVNGYMSQRTTSPKAGYLRLLQIGKDFGPHKNAQPSEKDGLKINIGSWFERIDRVWAKQLSIYAWLVGKMVDEHWTCCPRPFVAAIDQIVGPATGMRVATHRGVVSVEFQEGLLEIIKGAWEIITTVPDEDPSGVPHIFRHLDYGLNKAKCGHLDQMGNWDIDPTFRDMVMR
jgi:hypothetical protein